MGYEPPGKVLGRGGREAERREGKG